MTEDRLIIQQECECPGCPEGCPDEIGDLELCQELETIEFCCTLVIPDGFSAPVEPLTVANVAEYIEENFDLAAYFDEDCIECTEQICRIDTGFGDIAITEILIEGCIKFIGGICVASDSAPETGSQAPVCCEGTICIPEPTAVCFGLNASCENLRVVDVDNVEATRVGLSCGDAVWNVTGELVFACAPCPVTTTTTTSTTTSTTTTSTTSTTTTTTTTAAPDRVCFCQVTTAPGATIDECDVIIGDGCPCDCSLQVEVCTGCMVNGSQIEYEEGDNSLIYQQVGGSPFNVGELCSVTCPTDDTAEIRGLGEWNGELCNFLITLTEVPEEDDEGTITIYCPGESCPGNFDEEDIVYQAEFEFAGNSVNINPQPCGAQG
jgi:hypothetical protein